MIETGDPDATLPHVLIVEARFYQDIADELCKGAVAALATVKATFERLEVPGAFEIPAAIAFAEKAGRLDLSRRRFDCYVALGCVIRGETTHYDYVCGESARGLQELALHQGLAIGYGILTVENRDQAWARASTDMRNKGGEVTLAALRMAEIKRMYGIDDTADG